jgi:hypothetical protein
MYTQLTLQLYFQWKVCILQDVVCSRCGANILCKYDITLHVILVNIFITSYVTINEFSASGISIFYFCMLNLKDGH